MPSIFIIIYTIWGLSELIISRYLKSKETDNSNMDNNSLRLIWLGIVSAMTLSVYIGINYNFPISSYENIRYIGLIVIVIGIVLRLLVIKALGKFFTSDVTIMKNHQLKTSGFYHFLRHPSYTASLLSFIGFGLSLNNWISILIVISVVLMVFINRIKVEEKALIGFFGQTYLDYKKSTKALIPFVY